MQPERESNLCHALEDSRSNVLTEQVWTASPRSCRAGAFLNTGFLPGAGTSCHLTDGGWEDAIRGSPGLQSVVYKLHLCSSNRPMTIATVQPLIGVLPKPAHGSGTRGENVQVTLYSYWTTVTVERYRNWTLARETLDKDVLKLWSNIHIYEYCTIVHIYTFFNQCKQERKDECMSRLLLLVWSTCAHRNPHTHKEV